MRIVIVGPGALGCLLAVRMSLIQPIGDDEALFQSLCLIDYRPERATLLNHTGLILEDGDELYQCAVPVSADPASLKKADVLFLCVKSPKVNAALSHVQPLLSKQTLLIGLQNGIGHLDKFKAIHIPSVLGTTSEGATLIAPGHIRYGGAGLTRLGFLGNVSVEMKHRLERVANILTRAKIATTISSNIEEHIQAKLFINVGINALTAIHGLKNGALLDSEKIKNQMIAAVREAEAIALAQRIRIAEDPVAATLRVCRSTADNTSSMLQDILNKKRTEIDAINGAIVAAGEKRGIPTPVNRMLVEKVRELENR